MWNLPRNVYDLEPRSRYENEEPVLACRKTVKLGGNCQSLLTRDDHTWLGWMAKLLRKVETLKKEKCCPESNYRSEEILSACDTR